MHVICFVNLPRSAAARLRKVSLQLSYLSAFSLFKRVFRDALKANAKFSWTDEKTTTATEISTESFANGSVDFRLYAAPSYASADTGVIWATGLQFTDTITLSEGMTFKSAEEVKAAFSIPGVTISDVKLNSGNEAVVTWTVDSEYIKGISKNPF